MSWLQSCHHVVNFFTRWGFSIYETALRIWLGILFMDCAAAAAAAKSDSVQPHRWQPTRIPSLGFSRQEHWSGLPFPSLMQGSEKWKWSCSVLSNPQQPHGLQPTRLLRPWDFPGKSPGVGCHRLLWCKHWVSEWVSEVAQSCPTLCDPMDCNLPGSSIHGILQARVLEWGAIAFSEKHANTPQINQHLAVFLFLCTIFHATSDILSKLSNNPISWYQRTVPQFWDCKRINLKYLTLTSPPFHFMANFLTVSP